MSASRHISGFFLSAILLLAGCRAAPVLTRPPLDEGGAVYLYLKPFPLDADRLIFSLEGVAAVRDSGEEIPLSIKLKELSLRAVSRERLLAVGELPTGRYGGFLFRVQKASLAGEEDNAALQATVEPDRVDVPFSVSKKKANVFSLNFRYAESLRGGVLFTPRFTILPAAKTGAGLLGFATNRGSNTITVFDKGSARVSGVIPTGASPGGMAVDPVRLRGYVAVSGEDAVQVFDLLRGEIFDRFQLLGGDRPLDVALTPDGRLLITVNTGSNTISLFDPVSLTEVARIGVGNGPQSILLDSTGRRAYIFNTLSNTISVIDVPTRRVAATIATEVGPLRGQFNRKGDRLYVIHQWSPYLAVIDPFSLALLRKQYIGMGAQALKVDTNTDRIYIARKGGAEVEVYDPFTLVASDFLKVGGETAHMTIDGQENNLLLTIPGAKSLRLINLIRRDMHKEIDLEDDPFRVTVMGER